ncbi:MAG: type II secretion system GspH family protein [Gallionellaceae bacterium]|nr:type II secretion system GspH family protein [Gallionellaceae bacterium]
MKLRGFTLIELVVTVAIVSILASGVMPIAKLVAQREKEKELRASLRNMREAIDAYKKLFDEGKIRKEPGQSGYPPSLAVLVEGVVDEKDPQKHRIRFLRKIPADPMSIDPAAPAEQTWGLRSYASETKDPQAGDDVYDVYSLSTHKGLNGRPYSAW